MPSRSAFRRTGVRKGIKIHVIPSFWEGGRAQRLACDHELQAEAVTLPPDNTGEPAQLRNGDLEGFHCGLRPSGDPVDMEIR
jgi:hypothetical protein